MANITAKLNATTASGPKQVSVTVPATTTKLNRLQDVNVTSLSDGALLQYDDATKKWTSRSDILTESGNLILNGGTF